MRPFIKQQYFPKSQKFTEKKVVEKRHLSKKLSNKIEETISTEEQGQSMFSVTWKLEAGVKTSTPQKAGSLSVFEFSLCVIVAHCRYCKCEFQIYRLTSSRCELSLHISAYDCLTYAPCFLLVFYLVQSLQFIQVVVMQSVLTLRRLCGTDLFESQLNIQKVLLKFKTQLIPCSISFPCSCYLHVINNSRHTTVLLFLGFICVVSLSQWNSYRTV